MLRHFALAALLAAAPLTAQAQPATLPPTLAEAWLAWQEQRRAQHLPPFDWAYSHALRKRDAAELEAQQARLMVEIKSAAASRTARGELPLASGLLAWHETLSEQEALAARTPAPLGLPELAADLRRNPAMDAIARLGTCEPPAWIEAWTRRGVARLRWRPGMTLDGALARLPDEATRDIDSVVVITPRGERQRRGIAAWNHQNAALAPGARLVVQLPDRDPAGTQETALINRKLAAWLATRLPSDNCVLWEAK